MKKLTIILCLFTSAILWVNGQTTYDFRDGTIINTNGGKSSDGSLILSGGSFKLHSSTYGLNMKAGGIIRIAVNGSSTLKFLGSAYSSVKVVGLTSAGDTICSQNAKVATDLSDTYDYVYNGMADTLTFKVLAGTGSDLYLPLITVTAAQLGKDASSAVKNIIYNFDFRDGSIVPTTTAGNTPISAGLVSIAVGSQNAYGYNGTQHGSAFKVGNQIILQVAGNSYIKVGGCQYSSGTMSISSTTGNFKVSSMPAKTASCYPSSTLDFLYVGTGGSITLSFTATTYVPYIQIVPIPYAVSLETYKQKSGTVSLNGITLNLTSGATAVAAATLAVSDGVVLKTASDSAFVALNLAGTSPASFTPSVTGDIGTATITGDKMTITYSDQTTSPKTFTIRLYDNSYLHGKSTYDFRDGTIISAGKSSDGLLSLSGGSYSLHGSTYGMNMKANGNINIIVPGSRTFKFLGSAYSGLKLTGTVATSGDLGTQDTKVATDLVDTYDFVYSGAADTVNFKTSTGTGNDLYLPKVDLYPAQMGAAFTNSTKNIIYYYDFRDGSIVPTTTTGLVDISKGLVSVTAGTSNAYGYNGTQHGSIFKAGNRISLQVTGNSYIKIGGCQYSSGTMTVSSPNGNFDKTTQSSQTSKCYDQDGSMLTFLYAGSAGTVTIDFTGVNYIPYIEVDPYPYAVDLVKWAQKSGEVIVNGVAVDITSGATSSDNPTVTLASGTVISTTVDLASIRINLAGKTLSSVSTSYSGNISGISISGDTLLVTYADATTKPYSYKILIADNSTTVSAEAGKAYNYNLMDGSVLPQTSYSSLRYKTFISPDGILTINSNNDTIARQFGYHDAQHGAVMFPGNSMSLVVAGNATITFGTCQYGVAKDAIFEIKDASGKIVGNVQAKDTISVCGTHSLSYTGPAGVLTATLKSALYPTAEIYMHSVSVENAALIVKSAKTDVWDFGAAIMDTARYSNKLTADIMNSWYPGVAAGTAGQSLPGGFTAGVLSWVGGTNSDRIRTSNTALTRYDSNSSPAYCGTDTLTGNLYVNASATSARYLGLTLSADDEVTVYAKSQNGAGKMTFQYMADGTQKDVANLSTSVSMTKFTAKKSGAYHIYDSADKPFFYRVLRKDANYVTFSGTLNTTAASGIPAGYSVILTNGAGKAFADTISSGETSFSIQIPSGYAYTLSLGNANGYIITNGTSMTLNANVTHEIVIEKVITNTLSGAITGLNGTQLAATSLTFTPVTARVFTPTPVINTTSSTYSVAIEPNCKYKIAASGINDYYITNDTVSIKGDSILNIAFAPKPVYKIDITTSGLDATQQSKLNITFTNLNEAGYVYKFTKPDSVYLRSGVYTISCSGLDDYALKLGATSNLSVSDATASKTLAFTAVTDWSFDDAVITSGTTTSYKGMLFTGTVSNEIAKGHLVMTGNGTAKVPVNPGQKLVITYYYSAKFVVVSGDTVKTSSGSTNTLETKEFIYTGTDPGYMTITNISGTTTYLTDVTVAQTLPYKAFITVGTDKDYHTINDALAAARAMVRPSKERVKIMVDPGNYEEMLLIDIDSVSIINAAATPSIALLNKGVDIDPSAVRITSYYGHGYNYYSMGTDQKWSADALRINKENGYTTYTNTGSGTTNGSYWNATVVVSAKGFEAANIIFENSYNQYISLKESQDVVTEWASGGKGTRPTDYRNTSVQNKSFVERAAAIAYTASGDRSILYKCRIVGRQDSFYGAEGARVVAYKGSLMGGTDYIFGGMTLVAYLSNLAMNTSESNTDVAYITAAQQSNSRGYLMYGCTVTSAKPGTETASSYLSKPGELGRPWQASTSEVVFFNTTIEATNNPDFAGKSLIAPEGWLNTLGGQSDKCYEYGTIEKSGENNQASRVSWSHILSVPTLNDGTAITTFNFTKGSDNWDPLPQLISEDINGPTAITNPSLSGLNIFADGDRIFINNVNANTQISIYTLLGTLVQQRTIRSEASIAPGKGIWIIKADTSEGSKVMKVILK
jgi:hypothetical protein